MVYLSFRLFSFPIFQNRNPAIVQMNPKQKPSTKFQPKPPPLTNISDTVDEPGAGQQLLPSTTAATTATPTTAATPFTTIDELESEPSPNRAPSEDRVYNATTVPILRPKNLRNPDVIPTQQQQQRPSIDSSSVYSGGSSVYGDPNQVGLPVVKGNRWIPSQQRELLEKQANLLMSGANARRKRETEIF